MREVTRWSRPVQAAFERRRTVWGGALRCAWVPACAGMTEGARGEVATRGDVALAVAEIKQYVAESNNRAVFLMLGGIAVATAILGIVIAVT